MSQINIDESVRFEARSKLQIMSKIVGIYKEELELILKLREPCNEESQKTLTLKMISSYGEIREVLLLILGSIDEVVTENEREAYLLFGQEQFDGFKDLQPFHLYARISLIFDRIQEEVDKMSDTTRGPNQMHVSFTYLLKTI